MKSELKVRNKKNGRKILPALLILVLIVMTSVLSSCGQDTSTNGEAANEITVQVVVKCDGILEVADTLPEELVRKADDGTLIDTTVTVPAGSNALDASMAAGSFEIDTTNYVTSIEGVANGDAGPMSGWTYDVNSEVPSVGAIDLEVNDGDVVNWIYIVDFTAEQ